MFELQEAPVRLAHLNMRTEKHGEEDVSTLDIKFELVGGNALLDTVAPGLRAALYCASKAGDQGDMLASADGLTSLAFPGIEMPLRLAGEYPGYRASIVTGMGLQEPVVITGELKKFKVEAVQGGTAKLEFTVSAHPDAEDVSALYEAMNKEVELTLTPPEPAVVREDETEAGEDTERNG
jgi:hypothetical protein